MKKYIFVVLTLFAIPTLLAQSNENRLFSYIGISSTDFSGNFSGNWSTGTNLGLGIELNINEHLSFLTYLEYSYLTLNENNLINNLGFNNSNVRIVGGSLHKFNIYGNIKYNIPVSKMITPYIIAGLGYFVMGNDDSKVMDSIGNVTKLFNVNEYAFSSNFGAGIDIDFGSKIGMFMDVQYLIGFTENKITSIPFRIGINYKL